MSSEKIFGIGYSKTGTTSLAAVLHAMGYNHSYLKRDVVSSIMRDIINGEYQSTFNEIDKYDSFEDIPFCHKDFYKVLDKKYPDSKFILTTRRADSWVISWSKQMTDLNEPQLAPLEVAYKKEWFGLYDHYLDTYGNIDINSNIEYFKNSFKKRNEEIKSYFKNREDKLLILDTRESEEQKIKKIFYFLKKREPDFIWHPQKNKTAIKTTQIQHMIKPKNKVIIFGDQDLAQLANFYLSNDKNYKDCIVDGFTVESDFLTKKSMAGKPIVSFEEIVNIFPPNEYKLFAPITGSSGNKLRERIFKEGKEKGYEFISYISSNATVLTDKIGDNCFILEDNTIQPFVEVGNNVVMWSGNHIGHHSIIEDNVFFTSHVVLSGHCHVKKNAWFGVNATIKDGAIIEEGALIAMGSVLTKDAVEPWGIYMGSPAKLKDGKKSYEVL